MRPRNFSSEGVVLARKNYGEADRILVIYSKSFGKIRLVAKGVRKPRSRKRGHIEVFSNLRFSVSGGKGLGIITEAETISGFQKIRTNLKKAALSYFLMEVVGRLTHDEEKNDRLFELLISYLKKVENNQETSLKELRSDFIMEVLVLLGFWPLGKKMEDPDKVLVEITEREMSTIRVGKKILS